MKRRISWKTEVLWLILEFKKRDSMELNHMYDSFVDDCKNSLNHIVVLQVQINIEILRENKRVIKGRGNE